MALSQAAAAAVSGGVFSASSKNGGSPSSVAHIACSARPRSVPALPPSVVVSKLFDSSFERAPSRHLNFAVKNSHVATTKFEDSLTLEETDGEDAPAEPTSEASISALMADVANMVKLVDSRNIVELELKHKEYEIIIRKETAPPPPPPSSQLTFPGPHVMAHTSFPGYAPPPPPTQAPAPAAPEPAPVTAAPAPSPAKPLRPPMLSPMAGTFYRSPGPGEQPFVQVGDKVTKGQVVCIVEAMKLMNEIEADQSGTVVEIVAEDGKPISIEAPLFIIKP